MGFDPSVLLQAQGVQVQNPLDLATKGLTLGNLATSNQLNQMNLQGMQQYANAIPGLVSQNWSPQAIQQAAQTNPLGFAKALQEYKAQQLTQAQMAEAQGKAAQAQAEAKKIAMQDLAKAAYQAASKPAPTMSDLKNVAMIADSYGMQMPGTPPGMTASSTEIKAYLNGLGSAAVTPKEGVDMNAIQTKLGPEVNKLRAETDLAQANTGKSMMETQAIPQDVQTRRMDANAAIQNAGTNAASQQYGKAEAGTNPLTGTPFRMLPGGPQNPAGAVAPIGGMDGAPSPQTALTVPQSAQKPVLEKRLQTVSENNQIADRIQTLLPAIKTLAESGYNGPIGASDSGKAILGTLTSAGILPQGMADKFANMRASDTATTELLGLMAKEMSTRGSNMALKVNQAGKPGSDNPLEVRRAMIDALNADATNIKSYGNAVNDYVNKNPTDLGLVNFQPPKPTVPTPQGAKSLDSPPDPASHKGWKATGKDGTSYVSNGKRWVRQ